MHQECLLYELTHTECKWKTRIDKPKYNYNLISLTRAMFFVMFQSAMILTVPFLAHMTVIYLFLKLTISTTYSGGFSTAWILIDLSHQLGTLCLKQPCNHIFTHDTSQHQIYSSNENITQTNFGMLIPNLKSELVYHVRISRYENS